MRICENGIYRDMTEAEAAAVQAAAARAAAAERHRPLTVGEVQMMLIRAQINTLAVDDATAYRMREFYPAYEVGHAYKTGDRFMHGGGGKNRPGDPCGRGAVYISCGSVSVKAGHGFH